MAKDSTATPQEALKEEFVELLKTAVEAKGRDGEEAADNAVVQFLNDRESDIIALSTAEITTIELPTKLSYAPEDQYKHGCFLLFSGWPEKISNLSEYNYSALSYLAVNCKFSLFKKIIPYLGRAVPREWRCSVMNHDNFGWSDILERFFLHNPKEIKWILEYMPVEYVYRDYKEILEELEQTGNHDKNQEGAIECLKQQRNLYLLLKNAKSEQSTKCSEEIINFIEKNEDAINLKGFLGDELLLLAIEWNDTKLAETLLEGECNKNPYKYYQTLKFENIVPLVPCLIMDAFENNQWKIIELMISYGSDPKLEMGEGLNLFVKAVARGNLDKINYAFKQLSDDKPFADKNIIALAKSLHECRYKPEEKAKKTHEGWSPLAKAVFLSNINEVERLLKGGQTLNKSDIEKINTCMSKDEIIDRPSNKPIFTQQAPPTQQVQSEPQASPTQPGQTSSTLPLVTDDRVDASVKDTVTDNTNTSTSNEASDSSLSTAQSGHTSTSPAPVTSKPTTTPQQVQSKPQASPTQPGQTSSTLPLVTDDRVDASVKDTVTDNTNTSTSNEASDSSLSTAQSGHTSTSPAPVTSKPTTKLQQGQNEPQASPTQPGQTSSTLPLVTNDKMNTSVKAAGADNTNTSASNEASDDSLSTAQSGWLTSVLEWIKSILNWIIQRLGYSASTSLSGASVPSASADIETGSCTGAANGSTLNEEARGR